MFRTVIIENILAALDRLERAVTFVFIFCRDALWDIADFARAIFWLRVAPPMKSARIRTKAMLAQCRHRLSFAGGLFIVASPA